MKTFLVTALSILAFSGTAFAQETPRPLPETPAPPEDPKPAPVVPSPTAPVRFELTTLKLLLEKNVITQAEFDAAQREIGSSVGQVGEEASTFVLGKWSTTLYGFIKADYLYDSTQSFSDLAGNALVERPAGNPPPPPFPPLNYRGEHDRSTFSIRDSRFGLLVRAPQYKGMRALGQIEVDFFGNLPPIGPGVPLPGTTQLPYDAPESVTFSTPALRVRHANIRFETPIVDVLFGQYWHLFGWQNVYQPGSVQAQGLPGNLYSRVPQLRISKAIKSDFLNVELAAAASKPPARDSVIPDLTGGIRAAVPKWTGVTTAGASATSVQPLSVAVTGDFRQFRVPEFAPLPTESVSLSTQSLAVNAFIPVIPAKIRKGNSLSLQGEFVYGNSISDLYTQFTGGLLMPTVANTTGLNPPPQYPQNVDNGIVAFDLDGNLHPVKWTTWLVGAQYTLPCMDGRVWLAANYSRQVSPNAPDFTRPYESTLPDPQRAYYVSAALVRKSLDFFDVSLFAEFISQLRVGVEYAHYYDRYADGVRATNHRVAASAIFLF